MSAKQITLAELADMLGGRLKGDGSVVIRDVGSLQGASADAISFLANPKYKKAAESTNAGAIIVGQAMSLDTPQVIVDDPYSAFVRLMHWFHPEEKLEPEVHPSAVVEQGAKLLKEVSVGPLAVIGRGAEVGMHSVISAGCVLGPGSKVGEDCVLHPRVTLYPGVTIGREVIIHSGTVIGSDGFGFILSEQGHVKKPQVGSVIIEDRVEIGANCTIDRAMLDATIVGEGTKLDNLVHLAHNVIVGKHCIILAGVMVGGSTRIGDFCVISGNSTIKDNLRIGSRVMVVGHSGVAEDVPDNQTVFGYPAMPFSHAKRVYSRLKQLPDLFKRMRSVEKAAARPRSAEKDEY